MINFVLDILKGIILAITDKKISGSKSKAIRTFITLHDSLKAVEASSEELLLLFTKYVNSDGKSIKQTELRNAIRIFSNTVCKFASEFRRVNTPIEIFSKDLAQTFYDITDGKLLICRSLIEAATPNVCIDHALPLLKQKYLIRVFDYQKFGFLAKKVEKQWKESIGDHWSGSQRGAIELEKAFKTLQEKLVISRDPRKYTDSNRIFSMDELYKYENAIRAIFGCKTILFDDLNEIRIQLQGSRERLNELREGITKLEEFLSRHFKISDFF